MIIDNFFTNEHVDYLSLKCKYNVMIVFNNEYHKTYFLAINKKEYLCFIRKEKIKQLF